MDSHTRSVHHAGVCRAKNGACGSLMPRLDAEVGSLQRNESIIMSYHSYTCGDPDVALYSIIMAAVQRTALWSSLWMGLTLMLMHQARAVASGGL